MKQLTAILLSLLLCVSTVPAFAFELEPVESAAEVQSASDSGAALQAAGLASNDKAVLGDYPYIADGLGKVVVYNSGAVAADKIDYIDASIELASYVDESKPVQETWPYGVKTGEGYSTADVVDDPAGSGSKVICVDQRDHNPATHNAQYKVLYDNFTPKAGKYVLTYDLRFPADQAIGLYITARFNEKDVGTNISSAYLDAHRDEWLHFVSNPFTVAAGSTAKLDFNAIIINTIKYYLKNFTLYYYPANSFIIDDGSGLQLIEKAAGDTYTFPQADGIWVSGGDSYNPGDTVPVSLLEYKTFTLGEIVIENDGKTPGLNIVNGKTVPLTFDEEEAAVPGFTARNASSYSVVTFAEEKLAVSGNENGDKVFKVALSGRYPHIESYITLAADRPYYYEFDLYSNRNVINGTGNECLWIIGKDASGSDKVTKDHTRLFSAALSAEQWVHISDTITYKAEQPCFHIQSDAYVDSNSTSNNVNYYLDNVLVVPYYKVTYISDGAAAATAYLQPAANGAVYDTLTLDLSKTVSKTGYRFLGWSLTPSSSVADAPATVAAKHKDIVLYAVFEEVTDANITFMNGDVNLGTEALAFNSDITKFAAKDGCKFLGWSTTADGKSLITKVPENDITLYAAFEPLALETAYGKLLYFNDASNSETFVREGLARWNDDSGATETIDKYTFYTGNYTDNSLIGLVEAGSATSKAREKIDIVSDPTLSANPVMRITTTNNYPRFEAYLTESDETGKPTSAPGIYTVTYKLYVPSSANVGDYYTTINTNNSWSTGTNWNDRGRKITVTPDQWVTITESVAVPGDLTTIGKLGVFRLNGTVGQYFYIDDFAVYYSPTVVVTFMDGGVQVAQKTLGVGSTIEGVYSSTEYLNFQGWSTTPDGANIITTVPDTDIILYAAYDEIELETEYGELIYYTDFSGGVTTGTRADQGGSEYGYHEAAPTFDGIGAAFQSRSERASFAIANDPAGTGNPVVKVTENGWGYPRPSVTFNQVLTDPGIYTVSFRIFVPANSTNIKFYTYADTYNNDSTGPNIWGINRPRSFSPTLGAWTTVVGTYRVPEDLECLGVIGLLDDRSPSTTTYYLDDVAVYYQPATAPKTSADASIRLDTPATTGIRFRASITPRLREISTEYGFLVARKSILDSIGKTNADLTFDLTDDSVTGKKLFVSGAAYIKDENGTIRKDLQYSVDEATGDVTYTGVCVGITESYYKEDLVARPYAKLTVNGSAITVYGDSAQSSLYTVAKALQEAGGSYYEQHKDTIDAIVAE